jgi:hypothetical protein
MIHIKAWHAGNGYPLPRAATQRWIILDVPNRLKYIMIGRSVRSHDGVIQTCYTMTIVAFGCLVIKAHASTECRVISLRVSIKRVYAILPTIWGIVRAHE